MMKSEDLMIGDWVMLTSKYGCGAAQIAGIEPREGTVEPTTFTILQRDKDGNTKLFIGVRKYWVRPIPLTPEILEKNGFKKFDFREIEGQHQWSWWRDTLTSVTLWMRELNDEPKDGWMIRVESTSASCCIKLESVHGLQHALWICGIDKEIEL